MASRLEKLLAEARSAPQLMLLRIESHWIGPAVGLAGLIGGLLVASSQFAAREVLAAIALGVACAGMLLHTRLSRTRPLARVDFERRRVDTPDPPARHWQIDGDDWSILVGPGASRASMAIDLHHADRGRVARLVETAVPRWRDRHALSEQADLLAERLRVVRCGART